MTTALVLVAAGAGRRLGGGGPKALVEVAGAPLLAHALDRVHALAPDQVVVVHPPREETDFQRVCAPYAVDALVPGGVTRAASVRAGVAAVAERPDIVATHDAARAFTPAGLMRAVIDAVAGDVIAAAPGDPVADTLKRVEAGEVVATTPRVGIYAVQTPQAFRRDVLERALAAADDDDASDDLGLVERARAAGLVHGAIRLVAGSRWATKVTYPEDLAFAELLATASISPPRPATPAPPPSRGEEG